MSMGVLGNLQTLDISYYSGCKLKKKIALFFNRSVSFFSTPFDLVHFDMWGPSPIPTKGRSRYYVFFINDYTYYCWVYLMKLRYNFLNIYNAYQVYVKTQHSAIIKCFRCDLGGKYASKAFC